METPEQATPQPRWFEHRNPEEREEYAWRFKRIAEQGDDIDGEARFIDAMASRGATILDAGCGTGRVAEALRSNGHSAVGIDADPHLITRGQEFYPGLPLAHLDLHDLSPEALRQANLPTAYDLIVCAGNVMLFVAPDTEARIVANLASVLKPGGRLSVGFFTERDFTHDLLDEYAAAAGLSKEFRFGTWELDAPTPSSDWAVSVYRR